VILRAWPVHPLASGMVRFVNAPSCGTLWHSRAPCAAPTLVED
ncbi:MAG: hypothetical protein H6Q08_2783, partial [Acidobacteria bacterium]|nr:hypothetical protein [Acidobacteriota bacterium]